ncbi:MAG: hypothetical protein NTW96_11955, partial [Planctomycetia bacterium]|nr:hypothetical protein [Planctomycetia bacterium]
IFVGTLDDFKAMEHSVDRVGTRIFHPSYVKAKELETLITPLLTKEIGLVSVTSEAKTGIPSDMSDAGGDAYAGTEALVIRDYEAVLAEVDQLVAEVDVRPMQVHIEAMILSVQLDDKDNFGVNFELLRKNDNLRFGWGTVPQSFAKFTFDGGLKFGFLDENLGAFLDAVEKVGDTNVIATPRLMVLNKHAAEIHIGKSLGYVSTTQQTTTAATQTVEMLELGTQLRIRPFISPDGLIRMEIHPEISDGNVKVDQGFTLPEKETTQVTTNIMVRDGCTVVIGGLLQDEQKISRTQIPWLGNLPWVGFAFRNKNENVVRRELIILITPHIVREPGAYREGAEQRGEFERRHAVYAEHLSPISKQSLARRYIRKARNAWAAGDRGEALRLAEMAVQFDPRNREAIALRSDIWLGKPCTDQVLPESPELPIAEGPIGDAPVSEAMDGETIAPWVIEGLGQENPTPPAAAGPSDPSPRTPAPSTSVPGAAR